MFLEVIQKDITEHEKSKLFKLTKHISILTKRKILVSVIDFGVKLNKFKTKFVNISTNDDHSTPHMNEFEKWHAIRASMGGVVGVLEWVVCSHEWRANLGYVVAMLAWVLWQEG